MSAGATLGQQSSVAEVVRQQREALGISQTVAAKLAGVSRQLWSDIELGRRPGSPETLVRISEALQLPADTLLAMQVRPSTPSLAAMRRELIGMIGDLTKPQVEHIKQEITRQRIAALRAELEAYEATLDEPQHEPTAL